MKHIISFITITALFGAGGSGYIPAIDMSAGKPKQIIPKPCRKRYRNSSDKAKCISKYRKEPLLIHLYDGGYNLVVCPVDLKCEIQLQPGEVRGDTYLGNQNLGHRDGGFLMKSETRSIEGVNTEVLIITAKENNLSTKLMFSTNIRRYRIVLKSNDKIYMARNVFEYLPKTKESNIN